MMTEDIVLGLMLFTAGFMVGWFGAWFCGALICEGKGAVWG